MVSINGITELAKLLKERENESGYSPVFGEIIELPNTKVRLSDKIILTDDYIKPCFDYKEQNIDDEYIYLGKTAILLPYANNQKYIMIGVVTNVS